MARCWTCNAKVPSTQYRCYRCSMNTLIEEIDTANKNWQVSQSTVTSMQNKVLDQTNNLADKLDEITGIISWGFDEIVCQLQLNNYGLKELNDTLKSPAKTRANEHRLQGEELRKRKVYDEAIEFYHKSIEDYRLDFRSYLGMSRCLIEKGDVNGAIHYLEKGLPHALSNGDKGYMLRVLGKCHFCNESYDNALACLTEAIKTDGIYADGFYDFSQYLALVDDVSANKVLQNAFQGWGNEWEGGSYNKICELALKTAIQFNPLYYSLCRYEPNFINRKEAVLNSLREIHKEKLEECQQIRNCVNTKIDEAKKSIADLEYMASKFKNPKIKSIANFWNGIEEFNKTIDIDKNDYSMTINCLAKIRNYPNKIDELIDAIKYENRTLIDKFKDARSMYNIKDSFIARTVPTILLALLICAITRSWWLSFWIAVIIVYGQFAYKFTAGKVSFSD